MEESIFHNFLVMINKEIISKTDFRTLSTGNIYKIKDILDTDERQILNRNALNQKYRIEIDILSYNKKLVQFQINGNKFDF